MSTESLEETPSSPALILAKWNEYEHGMVGYTKKYHTAMERLRRFGVSPLLAKDLKKLISDFEHAVSNNLEIVGEVLTEMAKQLPTKYPTFGASQKADLDWIWNEYNHKRVSLEDKQSAILKYLQKYLQIENLLGKSK